MVTDDNRILLSYTYVPLVVGSADVNASSSLLPDPNRSHRVSKLPYNKGSINYMKLPALIFCLEMPCQFDGHFSFPPPSNTEEVSF